MIGMRSKIFVRGLMVPCRIGVTESERARQTILRVDLELLVDVEDAATSDDLEQSVDYRSARDLVLEVAGSREFKLLESFAYQVSLALRSLKGVEGVRVRVEKPGAPEGAEGAGVELEL